MMILDIEKEKVMSYYTDLLDFYRVLLQDKEESTTNTRSAIEELILNENDRLKALEN